MAGAPVFLFCAAFILVTCQGYLIPDSPIPDSPRIGIHEKYFLSTNKVGYQQAIQECEDKNMQLVSIQTGRKNEEIFRLLEGIADPYWTSANKILNNENSWRWLKGSPVKYFNWAEAEPNNKHGDENCIQVFHSKNEAKWNDESCQTESRYICEKLPSCEDYALRRPGSSDVIGRGAVLPNKGYFIGREAVDYATALKTCDSMCLSLVSIENEQKNRDIQDTFTKQNVTGQYWTSGNLHPGRGWTWINDKKATYFNWNDGEPNNAKGNEYCLEIFELNNKLVWNDNPCDMKKMFVCETIDQNGN